MKKSLVHAGRRISKSSMKVIYEVFKSKIECMVAFTIQNLFIISVHICIKHFNIHSTIINII